MRAAVIAGPGRFEIREVARPDPGPRQVRIRLEGCGVCGSNLPPWEGRPWFRYPFEPGAPGHEGWGVVDAAGAQVRSLREGDRVAAVSARAYAELEVVDEQAAVKLEPALDGRPFPGEPLACAMNVFRRSEVRAGHTVAVIGVGFLGAVLVQLAALAGARVIAIARRPFARALALKSGAERALPFPDQAGGGGVAAAVEQVQAITGGALCDRVIECTGAQAPLDLAGELARIRGRLVIAGYHQDGPRQINLQLWNWRGLDVINAHERDERVFVDGVARAARAVASGALDPSNLYTHSFSLERIGDAFAALRDRPDGFLKALVVP
jgi:threonine dehydrogenase-like Zn-dependent dehydrogenase